MALKDVSSQFRFRWFDRGEYRYHEGAGELGVPGKVLQHRSQSDQSSISSGTGDDAGHLIGNRFGAPGNVDNLGPQNWRQNRFGTFKQLENAWELSLKSGISIVVCVQDVFRKDEGRPYLRRVEWTEKTPAGKKSFHELLFANTHSPESRDKRNIPSSVPADNHGSVIDMFTRRRLT